MVIPSGYRYTRTQPRNLGQEQFEIVSRCAQLRVTAMRNKYLWCYFFSGTAIKQLLESTLYVSDHVIAENHNKKFAF